MIGYDSELVPVGIVESNFCDIDIKRIEPDIAYGDNINNTENATVSGYVYSNINTDSQGNLLNEDFTVKLDGTDLFAVTDSKGYFEIKNVPQGTYSATITKLNYLMQSTLILLLQVIEKRFKYNIVKNRFSLIEAVFLLECS